MSVLLEARSMLASSGSVAVLTGAGISKESGIPTFRGAGGLWRNYRVEELATPEAYATNPLLVWEWYKMRFELISKAQPNDGHKLLAKLEQSKDLTLVTQNVDGLHIRAGSRNIFELHGNITKSRCEACGQLDSLSLNFTIPPLCSKCKTRARPNVVWFGESLPEDSFYAAIDAFAAADLALIVGTSALVEPAASLARLAKQQGAYMVEINPERTSLSSLVSASLQITASEGLGLLIAD